MATQWVYNQKGEVTALITVPDIYELDGYRFVVGPARLESGDKVARLQGRRFQKVSNKWRALTKSQQEATRILPPPTVRNT